MTRIKQMKPENSIFLYFIIRGKSKLGSSALVLILFAVFFAVKKVFEKKETINKN